MGNHDRTVEAKLARIAARQHGVVTRVQLFAAGITTFQITRRLEKATLLREFRGVYRVGHRAPSIAATYMAAVLACGPGAVLSGLAAAYLLGLVRVLPSMPEVTAPTERRIPGVRTRRALRQQLRQEEQVIWNGIPVTSPARTLVDLAATLSVSALTRACHEADVLHGVTPEDIEAVLALRPSSPGARKLRRIIHGEINVTLSRLEQRFLREIETAGLPLPVTNKPAGSFRVDCRWPEHALTVELDGYRFHRTRHAWEQDHRREREARARGDDFRRYTWDDVTKHPTAMLAELRTALRPRRPA